MNENFLTVGLILLFFGGMLAISGSTFVTQGGVPDALYFQIGIIELVATIIAIVGIIITIRNA